MIKRRDFHNIELVVHGLGGCCSPIIHKRNIEEMYQSGD